jgi:PAS domain S-box-containing protein
VTFANKVALSLLRWPEQEISGKPFDEVFCIVNEETRTTVESPVARVLREGGIIGLANHTVLMGAERLAGWTNEEVSPCCSEAAAGRPIEEVFRIVNENSRQTVELPVAKVPREVVGPANHTLLISRDGTEIAVDDIAAPIRDTRDELTGVVLVFRDVTDKRAAEKVMAQQAAELRQRARLMERVVCFVRDLDDRIVYWNPGSTDLYGFAAAEAVGQVSHSLLKTVSSVPLNCIRAQLFEIGEWDGELVQTRRSGDSVTVASHCALHRDENGKPLSILEVNIDIRDRLELLAKERALASERALRQTEAELARVLRALSVNELATSMAHEVNQPLAGVVTNAEAGLRWLNGSTPELEEAKASLELIVRDANRASAVIRRVREFLKNGNPQTVSIDTIQVIQEAIALSLGKIAKCGIQLCTRLSSDLPRVRGDRVQLQQVILNLILNAVEAMTGTPEPKELLLISEESSDDGVLVVIRDTGAGISPQNMPHIFDAFFTTKPTGMGMGLSICRSIVEAHGGRIWAECNEGPGVTVQFALPAERVGKKIHCHENAP